MLHNVDVCGVICTTDLREYLPYFVVSYEEGKGTNGVTSGNSNNIKTLILAKADCNSYEGRLKSWQKNILKVSIELQLLWKSSIWEVARTSVRTRRNCLEFQRKRRGERRHAARRWTPEGRNSIGKAGVNGDTRRPSWSQNAGNP